MNSFTLDRALGRRYFTKEDGKVYLTLPTGQVDEGGKPVYEDKVVSESGIDASAALTVTEYKKVDTVVTETRNALDRFTTWMLGLAGVVDRFDGMTRMQYFYQRRTGNTTSRTTMNLEDDAPGTTISTEEGGVPLPLEFADWVTGIRTDPVASASAGFDVAAEKARAAAESVASGLDLRQINGWNSLTYKGTTIYGFRDVPTTLTVTQAGTINGKGWLSTAVSISSIYANIKSMVQLADAAKIPGPYVLLLPKSFRHRLAEAYSINQTSGDEKSLWMKILERPAANIPNVLGITDIKLVDQMDEQKGGAAPVLGEAYLLSLSPQYFRVLSYLPMQSFTMDLKGAIATKHRVAEGVCPLFKTNIAGNYGIVKLASPTE